MNAPVASLMEALQSFAPPDGCPRRVAGRLYVPRAVGAASPGLLYMHGGGFVVGSPESTDRLTRELAGGVGARVVSLDYALAPEHPYPAALHDCVDAARCSTRTAVTWASSPVDC